MSVLSLFAPSASDQEYLSQLIRELTQKNVEEKCFRIKELLEKSDSILRKDLLPLLQKIEFFLNQDIIDAATDIA